MCGWGDDAWVSVLSVAVCVCARQDYAGQWVHIDMATPVQEGERATGWGVALLLKAGGILDL